MELPQDVSAALVRCIGAYIRGAPVTVLPAHLRRLKGFRDTALLRVRGEVLSALDDDALRALIGEWLDDGKHRLTKADGDLLRIAAERADGWEQRLDGAGKTRAKPPVAREPAGGGEHAHRLREARDEVKRVKAESKAAADAERARSAALVAEVRALTDRATAAERRVRTLEKELSDLRSAYDKELKRAGRKTAQAIAAKDEVAARLKEMRAARDEARRAMSALEERVRERGPKDRGAPRSAPRRMGPRRPLPVPKGRLADAPETLATWLETADVVVLVDGYNVSKSESGFAAADLETQRRLVIQGGNALARRFGIDLTIVFDGSQIAPGASRRARGPAKVEYSTGEIADDHLVAAVEALPPVPVVVVTNDRELQDRVAALGATIATSDQLLALIR
ncbi:MAG TPA: NYN domain-containing protein [Actinomycetota bacterium]|nr:NYN domain-containing protein [Actinomycetota bacterium]